MHRNTMKLYSEPFVHTSKTILPDLYLCQVCTFSCSTALLLRTLISLISDWLYRYRHVASSVFQPSHIDVPYSAIALSLDYSDMRLLIRSGPSIWISIRQYTLNRMIAITLIWRPVLISPKGLHQCDLIMAIGLKDPMAVVHRYFTSLFFLSLRFFTLFLQFFCGFGFLQRFWLSTLLLLDSLRV